MKILSVMFAYFVTQSSIIAGCSSKKNVSCSILNQFRFWFVLFWADIHRYKFIVIYKHVSRTLISTFECLLQKDQMLLISQMMDEVGHIMWCIWLPCNIQRWSKVLKSANRILPQTELVYGTAQDIMALAAIGNPSVSFKLVRSEVSNAAITNLMFNLHAEANSIRNMVFYVFFEQFHPIKCEHIYLSFLCCNNYHFTQWLKIGCQTSLVSIAYWVHN